MKRITVISFPSDPTRLIEDVCRKADIVDRVQLDSYSSIHILEFAARDMRLARLKEELTKKGLEYTLHHRAEYDDAELEACDLLMPLVAKATLQHRAIELGTEYSFEHACPECGTEAKQLSPFVARPSDLRRRKHIVQGLDSEVLISCEVLHGMDADALTGIELTPVIGNTDRHDLQWRQVDSSHSLPQFSNQTNGIVQQNECSQCDRGFFYHSSKVPTVIVYDLCARELAEYPDVCKTFECFGRARKSDAITNSLLSRPLLLVKPTIFQSIRRLKIRNMKWIPVLASDSALLPTMLSDNC